MVAKADNSKKDSPAAEEPAAEVAPRINWGEINSLEEAHAVLPEIISAALLFGDGAELINDKMRFVGSEFTILDWHFIVDKKTNNEYVSVLVMNGAGNKARFNDGSTGVYQQLKEIQERYGVVGITCRNGLRRSDYFVPDGKGGEMAATTYYISS